MPYEIYVVDDERPQKKPEIPISIYSKINV